jgi:hypothetical protein
MDTDAVQAMRAMRALIRKRIGTVDEATFRRVPEGFNSNLAWQVGHLAVTPALLVYGRCKQQPPLDEELITAFRKGTAPGDGSERWSREELLTAMDAIVDSIEAEAGDFTDFEEYETSAGITLSSVDEVLRFLGVHDGIHVGYTLALARAAAA